MFKRIIKNVIPPVIWNFFRWLKNNNSPKSFNGNFKNWNEALKQTTGYNAPQILEKVKASLLKVKNGEAIFERDSFLLDKIQYSWPLLAILFKIASKNNNQLNLIDFGGSLGSNYFQNKNFLIGLSSLRWNIVEQENFVKEGRANFENRELIFFSTIEDAKKNTNANTLLTSGALQYIEQPFEMIQKILNLNFENIVVDRTAFINEDRDRLTIQTVSKSIYEASYPAWFFNERIFLTAFLERYDLIADFESAVDDIKYFDGKKAYWKGFFFSKKHD